MPNLRFLPDAHVEKVSAAPLREFIAKYKQATGASNQELARRYAYRFEGRMDTAHRFLLRLRTRTFITYYMADRWIVALDGITALWYSEGDIVKGRP
jgi:hypothetical protein